MYMTDEHAKEFMSLVEFAGQELLEGRYPQFAGPHEETAGGILAPDV